MKNIIRIGFVLLLLLCLSANALAASVTYVGEAEKFVFLPGSEYSDTDLFEDGFKGVLPGDVITQTITVTNKRYIPARIYMRAEPVDELHEAFLSQLQLSVTCKDEEIFDAAASETAQLTENTLLGTFRMNGSTELEVTLTVPADLGNEYMGTLGVVPWTFIVEEIPDDDSPHTGDWFQGGVWLGAACLLLALIVLLLLVRCRRRAEN